MVNRITITVILVSFAVLAGCTMSTPPGPPSIQLAPELTYYAWVEYMPQSVLEAFTAKYGVSINYETYESEEEAYENIRSGKVYDIVVLPPELIPDLIAAGQLAEIDYRNVPNFKYISANFRDLMFDPGNRYSIPFHWGTTGLLVRNDLVQEPVTHWADLWDERFADKVALWPIPHAVVPIALKSLGYPANSEDPQQLEEALEQLLKLKQNSFFVSNNNETIVPVLASGEAVIAYGWAYDAVVARQENLPISYILPGEGSLLWGDNFVIPSSSPNKFTAELFLNFILEPEISGQIVNESYYAMAHDGAGDYIEPEILRDPAIYPPNEMLKTAEVIMPLSPQGHRLYADIWERLMEAGQQAP
jgi:spermidine/putrescine transport system substrate-binding protein